MASHGRGVAMTTGHSISPRPSPLSLLPRANTWTGVQTFQSAAAGTHAIIVRNATDNSNVAVATFEGDRATVADNDAAYISLKMAGEDGVQHEVVRLQWNINDVTEATIDGRFTILVDQANTLREAMVFESTAAGVLQVVGNEDGEDFNYRWEADDQANLATLDGGLHTGKGAVAFGTTVSTSNFAIFAGTLTLEGANSRYFNIAPTVTTVGGSTSYAHMTFGASVTTPGAGDTYAVISTMRIPEPNITLGGGGTPDTATVACVVYFAGAPTEGSNNYVIWVDSGVSRFDDSILVGATAPETGSTATVVIGNGTAPDNPVTDAIVLFSIDQGSATVLGLRAETGPVTTNDFAMNRKIIINYNGTAYALGASTTLTAE